jgi:uncharacterized membrane protein YfcA
MYITITSIILGILGGVISGALAVSGAEFMLLGLAFLNVIKDYKTIEGTILLTVLPPIYLLAVIEYYRRKQVDIYVSICLIIPFFFAALYGAYLSKQFSETFIEYSTGIYFLLISIAFFILAYTKQKERKK